MRSSVLTIATVCLFTASIFAADWTRFRGPNGTGIAAESSVPTEWSSTKNLKWATEIPGNGTSSPIVVGDKVFVTCYTGYGLDAKAPGNKTDLVRHLLAFDRTSGKELWRVSEAAKVAEDNYQGFITQHGYASSTPTSDGQRVYVLFGKSGLFAFDLDGNKLWQTSLGTKSDPAKWGGGASAIVYNDLIIVNAGIVGNQLVAVNKVTGDKVWSVEDEKFTNCWSTPAVVNASSGDQILFNVPNQVVAVDPTTGDKIWTAKSPLNDSTCGSIVVKDDKAWLMGSRMGKAMGLKIGTTAETVFDVSLRSGINTPILVGKNLYWGSGGIFYAANSETGEYVYKERLPRKGGAAQGFGSADYSSPVAMGDRIIFFGRNGESYVVKAGDTFELMAHNDAFEDDSSDFSSTPAISDGDLFMRSGDRLYCISSSEQ